MRRELACDAVAGCHVLFDPALLAPGPGGPADLDRVEAEAARGHALLYAAAAEVALRVLLFVGEAPPVALARRAEGRVTGRLLRAPSGRLVLRSAGALDGPGGEVGVAPGEYAVEAFDVGPDAAEDARERAALEARFGRRAVRGVEALGLVSGCSVVAVVLGLPLAAFLSPRLGGPEASWVLLRGALAAAVLAAVLVASWWLPAVRRVRAAQEAAPVPEEGPEAVVVLTLLGPGEARPSSGGAFGDGYVGHALGPTVTPR